MSVTEETTSLEWRSVLNAVIGARVREELPTLDQQGIVAFTDGACIKNPGGPAGWSCLLWAAVDVPGGKVRDGAPCLECYGHIPRSENTTNNRAEIAAVLAVLSIAPPTLPLTIYSDSEYTIKVATGVYQMKANADLWVIYRKLISYRSRPPEFHWVRGHAGNLHNERADELAGLGAWNKDKAAYERWQASQVPEARNKPAQSRATGVPGESNVPPTLPLVAGPKLPPSELNILRHQIQKLKSYFDAQVANGRITSMERQFIDDMSKRLQKNNFMPSDKQRNWLKGLLVKYKL
jgi:ribonuclease HI